jgi:hypothetical protein
MLLKVVRSGSSGNKQYMMADPVNPIKSMVQDKMEVTNPPQCCYILSIDNVVATREHLVLKQHFKLPNGGSGRFGQILLVENKKFALQLYTQGTDADAICLPNMPQWIRYPSKVIPTNLVRCYHPAAISEQRIWNIK